MSLRLRVALAAAMTTLLVVVAVGSALVALVATDQREALDEALDEQVQVAARQAVIEGLQAPPIGERGPNRFAPNLNLVARVVSDGQVSSEVGDFPLAEDDEAAPGYSTVAVDGGSWRVLARPVGEIFDGRRGLEDNARLHSDIVVEVAVPTAEMDATITDVRSQIIRLGIIAVGLAGIIGWVLGMAALRPLARLRRDTGAVTETRDLSLRVADDQGLKEVDELGKGLNVMLDRIKAATEETEAALEASRAFAGNAAHELRTPLTSMQANLDVLERNPDLPRGEQAEIVADVQEQQRRLLRLLAALRLLARGDLQRAPLTDRIDLVEVIDEVVDQARRRHPTATFHLRVQGGPHLISGWDEGLRVLIDNLLDNAALHGRSTDGTADVTVLVGGDDHEISLMVDDRGPGIPSDERSTVFERFARGRQASPNGSGLGLALVAQQVELHHGRVTIEDGPGGGARLGVTLPASR